MDAKLNNADSTLAGDLQASNTTQVVVKAGEGALFGSIFPIETTVEHYEGNIVTKREVIKISGRSGDVLTIDTRKSQICVQDDSQGTKTRTQNALSFISGDRIYIAGNTEKDYNDLNEELYVNIPNDINQAKTDLLKDIQDQAVVYGSSSTGNDDYAITLDPVPATYAELKGSIYFLADVGNTDIATLNINGLGAKTIKKKHDQDLVDGDIEASQKVEVVYNSADDTFEMVSQTASIINVGEALYFGDGSDGALIVLNGETVTLNNDIYNYSSIDIQVGGTVNRTATTPLQIKCNGTVTIDGIIDIKGITATADKTASSQNFNLAFGVAGAGGRGGYRSGYVNGDPGDNAGLFCVGGGGSGGSTSNTNYRGGAGGDAGYPGGLGGAPGVTDQSGFAGGISSGGGGAGNNGTGGAGGDSYGNDGGNGSGSFDGGGGGAGGFGGGVLFLNGLTVEGTGTIDCSGGNGGIGGDSDGGTGCGGGGGGGGGGGVSGIIYSTYTFSGTINVSGGTGGARGAGVYSIQAVVGSNGTDGNSDSKNYNSLI